jgi:hypothetical protein
MLPNLLRERFRGSVLVCMLAIYRHYTRRRFRAPVDVLLSVIHKSVGRLPWGRSVDIQIQASTLDTAPCLQIVTPAIAETRGLRCKDVQLRGIHIVKVL